MVIQYFGYILPNICFAVWIVKAFPIFFQKLYYIKEAHNIFVTGLTFMPSSEAAQAITGNQDFTLLSISADNTIRLHQVAPRGND